MKREEFEAYVAATVKKQLPKLVSGAAVEALEPFVTEVATEAMRGKSDEKIRGRGTLSTTGVVKTLTQAAHRTYLQGRDLTPETVFTLENIVAVAPGRGKDAGAKRLSLVKAAEMFLGESLGPQAREVEPLYVEPYSPEDFPRIRFWAVNRTTQLQREHAEGVVALCLGAGFSGNAASYLRAEDVTRDEHGTVWAKRYDMPHPVPVAKVFADLVAELASRKAPEAYVLGRGENPAWHNWLNVGRDFHVLPSRLRATWAVAVCAAVRREVAVSAIGVANVQPFEKYLRTDIRWKDPLSDHVEALTDPFTDWPALRADQVWQPTPAPAEPVAKKPDLRAVEGAVSGEDAAIGRPRTGGSEGGDWRERSTLRVVDGGKQ